MKSIWTSIHKEWLYLHFFMTLDLLETYLFLSWFIFWVIESINFDIRLFAKAKNNY